MVHIVKDPLDMKAQLRAAGDKLVVIDFYATWCGPCKAIAPQIENLAQEMPEVVFLKVDVDENEDLASEYEITSMPTFIFIKSGKRIDSFLGASLDKLTNTIKKHA